MCRNGELHRVSPFCFCIEDWGKSLLDLLLQVPYCAHFDMQVNEILSRLREGTDTTTSSNSNAFGDSKQTKGVQGVRRKTEMQASSSLGLDNL